MVDNHKLPDTEQTSRMKQLALDNNYSCCGEMYRMLNHEELHDLVKRIKKGNLKLTSNLLYGRYDITREERFLENLDHYISYVRNHYYFELNEQFIIIENSLKNKYADILLSDKDFHKDNNYDMYFNGFRRMFFYNYYNNLKYYSKKSDKSSYIRRLLDDLDKYDYDDNEDILEIEKILSKVFITRKSNLCNANILYSDTMDQNYSYYLEQVEWVARDYYEKYKEEPFVVNYDDNYMQVGESIVLLNVCDDFSKLKNKDSITIEFGIKNSNFSAYTKGELLTKEEILDILDIYKKNNSKTKYDIYYDTIKAKLRFNFWKDSGNSYLDLQYDFLEHSSDHYTLSFNETEMIRFLLMIKKQLK